MGKNNIEYSNGRGGLVELIRTGAGRSGFEFPVVILQFFHDNRNKMLTVIMYDNM